MTALTGRQVADLRRLRADGHTVVEVAELVGCCRSTVSRIAPGRPGKVSNERLRAAFLESGLSLSEVARRVEWFKGNGRPDSSRVSGALGLRDDINGKGYRSRRKLTDWEIASRIADALRVDPWEVGL